VDCVPDPLLRKSGSVGNRTRTSGSVDRNSDNETRGRQLKRRRRGIEKEYGGGRREGNDEDCMVNKVEDGRGRQKIRKTRK
jgi:hypothetical protein